MSLPLLGAGMATDGPSAVLDLNFASLLSLTPSVGPTPSYTRASTGTYFNSSGVLTTAAINGPRFDHVYNGVSWVSKGLLVEEARTNLYLYSEDFSQGNTLVNVTLLTDTDTAPDGNTTADKITATASTAIHYIEKTGYSVSSSTVYTTSVFAKYGTHRYMQLTGNSEAAGVYGNFDLLSGVVGSVGASTTSQITNVGGGWYRCSITYTATTTASRPLILMVSSSASIRAESNTLTTGDHFLVWGCQQEAGAFPTSYIPTTTAAVTRSADVCEITGGDFSGFWNEPAGTLVAEGDTPASGTRSLVSANNTTANESSVLRTVGTDPLFVVTDGGVAQASIDAGTVSAGTAFKLAAAYTVNDFAVSKDGAAVVTDTSGTIPTPTQITIGTDAAGNYVCGRIARLRYFNTRLLNSQLVALST